MLNSSFRFLSLSALTLFVSANAFAYGDYGAIAFDRSNPAHYVTTNTDEVYGSSDNVKKQAQEALQKKFGQDISNIGYTWAMNGWVALAISDNNIAGTSTDHSSRPFAEITAKVSCIKAGGTHCHVIKSFSAFADEPSLLGFPHVGALGNDALQWAEQIDE
jgi:hypothetical protein